MILNDSAIAVPRLTEVTTSAEKTFRLLQEITLKSDPSHTFVWLDTAGNEFDRFTGPSVRNEVGRRKHLVPHWNTLFSYLKDGVQSEGDAFGNIDIVSIVDNVSTQALGSGVTLLIIANTAIDDEERPNERKGEGGPGEFLQECFMILWCFKCEVMEAGNARGLSDTRRGDQSLSNDGRYLDA